MKVVGRPLVDDRVCPRCGARPTVAAAIATLGPSCLFATALDEGDDDSGSDEPPFEIVTTLARDAAADVRAVVAFCRRLGIALRPQPYAAIESVRAALRDSVA